MTRPSLTRSALTNPAAPLTPSDASAFALAGSFVGRRHTQGAAERDRRRLCAARAWTNADASPHFAGGGLTPDAVAVGFPLNYGW